MIVNNIKRAKEEAQKFIDKCDNVLEERVNENDWYVNGSKQTGALRRSSMDLTRSLAILRANKVVDRNA